MTQQWEGKSRGPLLGYKIFLLILRFTILRIAYFILYFVALYYFLFASSRKHIYFYFKNIHHLSGFKLHWSAYRNYYIFGQTLIDKFGTLSGLNKSFEITHEGIENLEDIAKRGTGAIFVSAHIGNWELAGNKLNRLNTRFNVLMYDNEREALKKFAEDKLKEKRLNIIPIDNEGMSHIIALNNAFKNGEILVMHSDRFVAGAPVIETDFMGYKADFPIGPYYLALKFGVPIVFVYAVKSGYKRYHFFASKPVEVERTRGEAAIQEKIKELMKLNIQSIENMVKRFPLQWFNYYQFWKN